MKWDRKGHNLRSCTIMKMYNFTTYLTTEDNTKANVILRSKASLELKQKICPLIITLFVYYHFYFCLSFGFMSFSILFVVRFSISKANIKFKMIKTVI